MRPLIICSAGYDRRIDRYINSCLKYVKSADLQITSFTPHIPNSHIKINKSYPGHINKYFEFNFPDLDRWYIFTDMYDVIFQADIPDLNKFDADILVSSEGELWRENTYYTEILKQKEFQQLLNKTVFCSGTFAMKGKFFVSLIEFYKEKVKQYKGQLNQPLFNVWLQGQNHKDCKSLFGTLYANIDKGNIVKKDKEFFWRDGSKPAIVHGNGSYSDKYLTWV